MAQQIINVGAAPNDGQGDPIRTSFIKCNDNFTQLYLRAQPSPPPTLIGVSGDEAGMYAYDSTYFYYCFADYDGSSTIWAQVTQIGNISVSSIVNGNSQVAVTDVNGNVAITVDGVSNVAVFNVNGILATGIISATGNVTGNYILGNGSLLTGLPETYANANVAAYLPTYTGNISANNISVTTKITTGTVSASGNVTSGNLLSSGLISTSGNIASQGRISASGNIETAGYFVGTFVGNVTGNFVVPGSNTQVIFNTNGNADAVAGMTFDTNGPNLFTVLGTISSQGNVIAGNLTTAGRMTATGNVIGGNITTAGIVTATGNVIGGNITTAGVVTATGNVTGGNLTTAGAITATGNVIGGNIRTAGLITATGNIRGGNIIAVTDLDVGGNATANRFTGVSVSVTGNITGGNIRTAGLITATGNIIGNYFIGNGSQLTGIDTTQISNGTSNVKIATSNGNVVVNVNGVSPISIFADTGLYVVGIVSSTGNITGGNLIQGTTRVYKWTTQANTAPSNAVAGDEWYNSYTDKLYKYINDGTSSQWVDQSFPTSFDTLAVSGAATIGGTLGVTGNITGANLVTTGTASVSSITKTGSNAVGNIGSSSNYFNTVFAQATSAQYADLAEHYASDADYEPGTVVVFGGSSEITVSGISHDTRVAGVVSSKPAYIMNAQNPGTLVALAGRVPCKVQGPVSKGDRLVNVAPGIAGKFNPVLGELGCVIGKSLMDIHNDQIVLIEISVGRT